MTETPPGMQSFKSPLSINACKDKFQNAVDTGFRPQKLRWYPYRVLEKRLDVFDAQREIYKFYLLVGAGMLPFSTLKVGLVGYLKSETDGSTTVMYKSFVHPITKAFYSPFIILGTLGVLALRTNPAIGCGGAFWVCGGLHLYFDSTRRLLKQLIQILKHQLQALE